jgi:hypothetical protein
MSKNSGDDVPPMPVATDPDMNSSAIYTPRHGPFRTAAKSTIYALPFAAYALLHGAFSVARARRTRIPRAPGFVPGNSLSEMPLRTGPSSDTLFILGSGGSINDLNLAQWERIGAADSVGFNFWLIHDFVPTYFVFEQIDDPTQARIFFELLERRAHDYRNVPMIMRSSAVDPERIPDAVRPQLFASASFEVPGRTVAELRRALDWSRRAGIWTPGDLRVIPAKRASLSYLLFLGWFLGYGQIVLCGVDLNHTRYFYEDDHERYLSKGRPIPDSGQHGTVHRTLDKRVDPLTVDEVIQTINEGYLIPRGVSLFIASKQSALYPMLPHYEGW